MKPGSLYREIDYRFSTIGEDATLWIVVYIFLPWRDADVNSYQHCRVYIISLLVTEMLCCFVNCHVANSASPRISVSLSSNSSQLVFVKSYGNPYPVAFCASCPAFIQNNQKFLEGDCC